MPDDNLLLEIRGLQTHFTADEGLVRAVDGVDLDVHRNTTLCVVGESGCGKSITTRSILRLVDPPGQIVGGTITWFGENPTNPVELTRLDPDGPRMQRFRGGDIGTIFQEPIASLSPMHTVGDQLIETIRLHTELTKEQAYARAVDGLKRVGIPRPEAQLKAYPFQLSGGMCQRAMIAIALSCQPELLIADEPTTALDVTTQARILDLIRDVQRDNGMAVLFITHDLGVVAEMADEVAVMYLGKIVERGSVDDIFHDPQHPYTKALLRSVPKVGRDRGQRLYAIRGNVPAPENRPRGCSFHPRCDSMINGTCDRTEPVVTTLAPGREMRCHLADHEAPERPDLADGTPSAVGLSIIPRDRIPERSRDLGDAPLLEVRGLTMQFPVRRGLLNRAVGHVRAVDEVDLTIKPGETLGLVGESGCGKTTLGRCIVRSLQPNAGTIRYLGEDEDPVDLAQLRRRALRPYRRELRVVFQDPFSSLNPRMTLLQLVGDPLKVHGVASGSELEDRVASMLRRVGLRPEYLRRYPHAFSGGERQRINIARALILNPRFVVCDEAVSALDVSIRAQILNLLQDLQDEFDLTYLFISHDLSVVEHLCDRVAVMYLGQIVESAETSTLFAHPRHPYTEALLSAVPRPDPRLRDTSGRVRIADDLPDPANPPAGCRFHTRCRYAVDGLCDRDAPTAQTDPAGHISACHLADQLDLAGPTHEQSRSGP